MASANPTLKYTPVPEISTAVAAARKTFDSGKTKNIEWRVGQLKAIKRLFAEKKDVIVSALRADLHRPELECVLAEILVVAAEVDHALAHIHEWVKSESVATPAVLLPGSSFIQHDPLGVVCIIAPWNFPIQLVLAPLVACIAAGNTAVIKPSEVASNCAVLTGQLVREYLDTDAFKIVQGGVEETNELLKQRFDHILYTGNGEVAKLIMAAASKNLTPVTLELGGKSPTIVDEDADLDLAAKRILVGKCLNAGQVCLAPDYLLVHKKVVDQFTDKLISTARTFYGEAMKESTSLSRIINARHYQRVSHLLDTSGGKVVFGGNKDASTNYIDLTFIRDPSLTAPVMQEEIFGPLLPILSVENVDEAIKFINNRPKPLAVYVFTSTGSVGQRVITDTSSGGAVINDVVVHNAVCDLPFGGVGASGMGAYHGRTGFEAFSHRKAVFHQSTLIDSGKLRYPPYSKGQLQTLEWIFKAVPALPHLSLKDIAIAGLTVAVALLAYKLREAQNK